MHWQRHKGGAQHHRVAERLGKRLPVAVALGPDPALAYSATAPMPEGLDELMLAGFLRRERVELVKCVTVDLEVPANAQIVLEGYVEPGERRREGPFGDHTGFYSHRRRLSGLPPDLHHAARKRPIYLTTVVGIPPMEDYYLGKASERIFLPLIRRRCPRSSTCTSRPAGIFHNIVLVSIDKRYPGPRAQDHERVLGPRPADVLEDDHRRRQGRRRAERGRGRLDRRARTTIPSATSSSRAARSTTSRTPAICRPTAARWASTRRASGRPRASRAPGRSSIATTAEAAAKAEAHVASRSGRDGSA